MRMISLRLQHALPLFLQWPLRQPYPATWEGNTDTVQSILMEQHSFQIIIDSRDRH